MTDEYEVVREKIAEIMLAYDKDVKLFMAGGYTDHPSITESIDQIISIKEIAIIAKDQSLPISQYLESMYPERHAEHQAQQTMLKSKFKRLIEK